MVKQTLRESLMNEGAILSNEQMGFVKGGTYSKYKKGKKSSKKSKKSGSGGSGSGKGHGGHKHRKGAKCYGW
jgi:hypothetical protein